MTIEEIRARLEVIAGELRSINESAGDGDLTAEQTARWEELETEHGTRTEELRAAERAEKVRESRSRWGATQVAPVKDTDTDVRRLDRGGLQSRAMRLVDSKETEQIFRDVDPQVLGFDFDGARAQEHISKLIRKNDRNFRGDAFARYLIASESDAYRSAFGKLMARGSNAVLTAEEGRAVGARAAARAVSSAFCRPARRLLSPTSRRQHKFFSHDGSAATVARSRFSYQKSDECFRTGPGSARMAG